MRIVEWIRAWGRGERKIKGTKGLRGRVYEPRRGFLGWLARLFVQPNSGGRIAGKTEPIGTISARVYRKATGEWEDLGVLTSGRVVDGKIEEES